jgi:hypothetical protein
MILLNIFPIDPTPFIIPYAVVFFLLPWLIYVVLLFSNSFDLIKKSEKKYKLFIPFLSLKEANNIYKSNSDSLKKYKKLKKWLLICVISWIAGFFLLALILFIMESNNLLINHSKGLYGPNEVHMKDESTVKP